MKKLVIVLMLFVILLPGVSAESTVTAWIKLGDTVGANGYTALLKDVSFRDGTLLVGLYGKNISKTEFVPIGGGAKWGENYLLLYRTVTGGDVTYFNITYTFPYLLEGQKLVIGDYEVYLKSVNEKSALLILSRGDTSKEFKYVGGTLSFEGLRLSLDLMPTIFEGYLVKGALTSIGEWGVRFDGYKITGSGNELLTRVFLNINGKEYISKPGETLEVGGLILKIENPIGSDYLRIKATLRGAYVNARILPDFQGWLRDGKTERVGPYLFRVEAVGRDGAYIAVMNPCGKVLKRGFVSMGEFAQGLYYGGLMVIATGIRDRGGVLEVGVVAFIDPKRIPRATEAAYLNVTVSAPRRVLQYEPFAVNVSIINQGSTDVGYVKVIPRVGQGFRILGDYPRYIEKIGKGKRVKFSLTLLPEKSGNLSLGDVLLVAHVPYELSCYGVTEVNFTSERRRILVAPARIEYQVSLSTSNGSVGKPLVINVSVKNLGNIGSEALLTVALPDNFGIKAENFTIYNKWISRRLKVNPNESQNFTITVFPARSGTYKITAGVESWGKVFSNSTVITIGSLPTIQSSGGANVTNGSCESKVVTKVVKVAGPCNCTNNTKTNAPATGGLTLKEKIMYIGGSFLGGVIFILGVAWLAARMEEEE